METQAKARLGLVKLQEFGKGFLIGLVTLLVFLGFSGAYLSTPAAAEAEIVALFPIILIGFPIFFLVNLVIFVQYASKNRWWVVAGQAAILVIPMAYFLLVFFILS